MDENVMAANDTQKRDVNHRRRKMWRATPINRLDRIDETECYTPGSTQLRAQPWYIPSLDWTHVQRWRSRSIRSSHATFPGVLCVVKYLTAMRPRSLFPSPPILFRLSLPSSFRPNRRAALLAGAVIVALGLVPAKAASQSPPESQRARLEAAARAAEAQQRTEEAFLLRTRLQSGDFQEGDRILISLSGLRPGFDTVVVRAGKVIQFQGMDDLSLEGVLRSELADRLSAHVSKYLRDPTVRAIPLLRLGVFGNVGHPNYYYTPADVVLPDVIMLAGGVGPQADLDKATIRRGTTTIWSAADTRAALADGMSLDRLSLRANDEIHVPQKPPPRSWQNIVPIITGAIALALSLIQLSR